MINAEIQKKEEKKIKKSNSYQIPSNITNNSINSSTSIKTNSKNSTIFKSTPAFSSLIVENNNLISKSMNMATVTSTATLLPNFFNFNTDKNLTTNLNSTSEMKKSKNKNKKKIDSLSACFKARSTSSISGLDDEHYDLKVNNNNEKLENVKNSNSTVLESKLSVPYCRELKQTLSLDHDLLKRNYMINNDHIDEMNSGSQVQNLFIKNKEQQFMKREIGETVKKAAALVKEKKEEKDNLIEEKKSTLTRQTIELNKNEDDCKRNEKREIIVRSINEIKNHPYNKLNSNQSTAILNSNIITAKNIRKEEKIRNINKSADLVNHLVSCTDASKERINEDKLNSAFSLNLTIDNLKTTSKKIILKNKTKSKSINNLGDCSTTNHLNVTNDNNLKKNSAIRSNSFNQLSSEIESNNNNLNNNLNDNSNDNLNDNLIDKKLNNKITIEKRQLNQSISNNATGKLNQKQGGAFFVLKKFAKGFQNSSNNLSKNRIRESLYSQSKNCIEQLLLHEQCKSNNKCTSPSALSGIKNEFKMRFRRSDLDKEYNLTKSMKSVDYKDLTLMQILAFKKIRTKLKSSNQEKNQDISLKDSTKLTTINSQTSQESKNLNNNNNNNNNTKMVLPELKTSPICAENAPSIDCFEIYSKKSDHLHESFTTKLIKNDESFNCENIQSNKQIINNKNQQSEQFIDQCKSINNKCDSEIIYNNRPNTKWIQLSGHEQSFFNSNKPGIILKKNEQNESTAYRILNEMNDKIIDFMPKFYSVISSDDGYQFIELQDLLAQFDNPCIMDLKMGSRTFLETDVSNMRARPDLYEKLIKIDQNAATEEEHQLKAITKLRWHFKKYKTFFSSRRKEEEVKRVLKAALPLNKELKLQLLKRLKLLRLRFKESDFFKNHEIVGSSLLIVYDDHKINVWIIDLAKCVELPNGIKINHERMWNLGNHEDGYLTGLNNLISIIKEIL